MKKFLPLLLLLLAFGWIPKPAQAQFVDPYLADCATNVTCSSTGPANSGTGDPWYVFAYKYNQIAIDIFASYGPTSHLALYGTVAAGDVSNLFGCAGNASLFLNGAGGCTAGGGGGGGSGAANLVLATPNGSAGPSTLRALVIPDLPLSGANAGTFTCPTIAINVEGLVTSASTGSCGGGGGGGTVTSVSTTVPSPFQSSGCSYTTFGTCTITLQSFAANLIFASPNGAAGIPGMRALVAADVPQLNQNTSGTAAALAATPAQCSGGQYSTGVQANGNANCGTPTGSGTVSNATAPAIGCYTSTGTVVVGCTPQNTLALIYANLTTNNQTGSTYTFALADQFLTVAGNSSSAQNFTIPPNSSVNYPLGVFITAREVGAGIVTVTPGAGVSVCSPWFGCSTSQAYSMVGIGDFAQFQQVATNQWELVAVAPFGGYTSYGAAHGTFTVPATAIATGYTNCTLITQSYGGLTTADKIYFSPNADVTTVVGWQPSSNGWLQIEAYASSGAANFKVCNPTAASITPGAATTWNWGVTRP